MYGDAFPHETAMDQLGGVDFDKGCFIGQEVVSRTQHRGTARTRIMSVAYEGFPPDTGVAVLAGAKQVGTMGSGVEGRGVALLRLDRIADAAAAGLTITAGGVPLSATPPAWAQYQQPA
jgi:folate-binding protein YgfZ